MISYDDVDVYIDVESSKKTDLNIEGSRKMIATTLSRKSSSTKSKARISLSDIAPDLAMKLRHLDLGNDGYIDIEDILVLDEKEKMGENTVNRIIFIIIIIIIVIVITYCYYYYYYYFYLICNIDC